MSLSKKSNAIRQHYRNVTKKSRMAKAMNGKQFELLLGDFESYCNEKGFYRKRWQAIDNDGFYIFDWQWEISYAILRSLFCQIDTELSISILRQVGKTEFVGLTTAYCFEKFFNYFGRPLSVAIIAPERDTACVPFERTEAYINKALYDNSGDTKRFKRSVRGDTIQFYGIYDEYRGSTIEGRSFDLVIRDEAHKGSDRKFVDEVEPTMGGKVGCLIMIGNGGFHDCLFKKAIDRGTKTEMTKWGKTECVLVKYTYSEIKPYFEQLAEAGLESARLRLNKIDRYIERHGIQSIEVRKNYFCEWLLEFGNVTTREQMLLCQDAGILWENEDLYIGLDFATMKDRTVATFMTKDRKVMDWYIVKDAFEVLNARDQMEKLKEYCDDRGYTEHLLGIGYDATGVGKGGINEFLQEHFFCDLVPFDFSIQSKHQWYKSAIESINTGFDIDRMSYNPFHNNAALFESEWLDLQEKTTDKKKFTTYELSGERGVFDDFVASFAICLQMVIGSQGSFYKFDKYSYRKNDFIKPQKVGSMGYLRNFVS